MGVTQDDVDVAAAAYNDAWISVSTDWTTHAGALLVAAAVDLAGVRIAAALTELTDAIAREKS